MLPHQTRIAAPPISIRHARKPPLKDTADDGAGGGEDDVPFVPGAGAGAGTGECDGDEAFLPGTGCGGGGGVGRTCEAGGVPTGGSGGVDDDAGFGGAAGNARGAGAAPGGDDDVDFGGGGAGDDDGFGGEEDVPSPSRTARTTTMRCSPALHRAASGLMKKYGPELWNTKRESPSSRRRKGSVALHAS